MVIIPPRWTLLLSRLAVLAAALHSAAFFTISSCPSPNRVRQSFVRMLDRPRVELDARSIEHEEGDYRIERGSFASDAMQRVTFVLVKRRNQRGRFPAVISLHGTGGNKDGQLPLLRDLAMRGFVGIAIDGRYHGERVAGGATGSQQYQDAIIRAWRERDATRQEHPFYFDTAWDLWRTVDYLQTRRDVDRKRIGAIGFSKGGIEVWLGAAIDRRISVIVPAISVQSFRWSLDNDKWQARARTIQRAHDIARDDLGEKIVNQRVCRELWNKVVPGILNEYDCPSMIRLIAPRPLLILSGEIDPNCPLPGAKIAFASAEDAYKKANASDRLQINVAPGTAHKVTDEQRQAAIEWFERWLKSNPISK